MPDVPALANATEAAVIVAREKYDRGEFRRAVVRRVPRDLFGDDLILECGHTTHGHAPRRRRCRPRFQSRHLAGRPASQGRLSETEPAPASPDQKYSRVKENDSEGDGSGHV